MSRSYKIMLPKINIDWALGFLLAIPFAYPKEPFYWIAIIIFVLGLYRFRLPKKDQKNVILVLALILLVALVNILNSIYTLSVFGTYLALTLLLFRYIVKDSDDFLYGFSFVTTIYAFATFIMFILLKPYNNGLLMFINSDYRMWAEGYLIEWPNVFCAFLVLGGFIHVLYNNLKLAYLHFTAAVLTTSRTALLAILVLAIYSLSKSKSKMKYIYILLILTLLSSVYLMFNQDDTFVSFIFDRLIKTSDRGEIYNILFETFIDNIFGIGNVPFEQIDDMYESYHSSYLKVLSRYGIIGFLIYVGITCPKGLFKEQNVSINMPIIFLILCGIVQDFMFHLHITALYSVLLSHRDKILNKEC